MSWESKSLYSRTPRSFLFAVVANVGPGGASRTLAVAYRQHHDKYNDSEVSDARVHHMVTDILALIEILSDPANRAPLEAERALAEDWYRRSPHEPPLHERPSIPDTAQPPYVACFEHQVPVQQQPQLPWHNGRPSQFPFIITCVLLALLRDDPTADATRPSDIQFQPLSTVFRADCTEYGLVILDISNLNSGVQYGIAAFPIHYMATVWDPDENMDWDPAEDDQPEEVDIVLVSPRPRVPLSIAQWIRKYYSWSGLEDHPGILRLEERPLADAAALDYIWPPELEDPPPTTSKGMLSRSTDFRPSAIATHIQARSTLGFPSNMAGYTVVDEPPQNMPVDIDHTIDNLLVLTQEPISPLHEKQALAHLQILIRFRAKLRQRLEEMPDRLGPSIISSYILRVAYTEYSHLNWVVFRSLPPRVIAAAIASDELQGASALSLCVDTWIGDEEEGVSDLVDLAAVLAQSTGLQQLCFLQRPDWDQDNISSRFCSQLLRLWGRISGEDWEWLRPKTIYSTSAFLTGLHSRKFPTSSLIIASGSSFTSHGQVFPRIHLFTSINPQYQDIPDTAADRHIYPNLSGYSAYYSMENTGLTAENFAIRFLEYLRSLGPYSDPNKAILRVAYHGAFSSLASTHNDNEQHHRKHGWSPSQRPPPPSPLRSSPDRLGVRPIPAGFFDTGLAPDNLSKVRLGDIPPGSWVVLVDRQDRSCRASNGTPFLQYSFIKTRQSYTENAPEQQSSSVAIVGGLTDFLRETAPGTDIAMWEKQVEEVERDLVSALMRPSPPSTPLSADVETMMERANESFRRLAEASTGMSASSPPPDMDRPTWEKRMQETYRDLASYSTKMKPLSAPPEIDISTGEEPVVEVERERCIGVGVMAESRAYSLLDQLV